ncbi:hypothetical protein H5410_034529 [Solanum commersonii]|uniref:LOB domain-containing protein n=1 Tax=Solanum commersonii TaxID=4109 RepID=A0A9J5YTM9_SOLCO|nr:hypothetical protein H5410_034529 [Solanum commersonii]
MNSRLSKKNKHMPCSACKLLRRRCTKDCIFLPHFPPAEPHKFIVVHRIFGASNITKMLQQEIPMDNREDAVISMVYEATARLRDPVYGSLNEASAEAMFLRTQLSNASTSLPSSLLEVSPFTPENHEFHHSQKSSQQNAYSNNDLQLLLPEAADYCFQETDQVLPLPY